MTERRLPPALEARKTRVGQCIPERVLLDWLYGKDGEPGLVGRVQARAAELFAGWKDRGEEDISLAWGLALRAELADEASAS